MRNIGPCLRENATLIGTIIALIVAIGLYINLANELTELKNVISNCNSEKFILTNQNTICRENNNNLFKFITENIKNGILNLSQVGSFFKEAEAQEIKTQVTSAIKASLPVELESFFSPSGWMGDGGGESGKKYLSYKSEPSEMNGEKIVIIRIEYTQGEKGWAGIYWQYPDGNWGDKPGRTLIGAKQISFYAKGEGGDEIVEFKAGGIANPDKPYKDSFEKPLGKVILSKNWTKYVIDLSNVDLSNVIGAFAWIASGTDNKGHVVTYIAKLLIE